MIADTSFLIALIHPGNDLHADARALYEQHGPQVVQQTVLAELLQVVESQARRAKGAKAAREEARLVLDLVTNTFGFHVRPVGNQRQAMRLFARSPKLSQIGRAHV